MVVSLLMFSGSISLVSRYEGNWKPVPQACSRPFSQDDWSCVSFSYLCSALEGACQETVFLILTVPQTSGTPDLLVARTRQLRCVPCMDYSWL